VIHTRGESFDARDGAAAIAVEPDSAVVTIPDAHFLFTADFKRKGSDLVLTGEDGHKVLVPDYFRHEKQPDLVSPEGALLSASLVELLSGSTAPGQYAQAGPPAAQQPIGRVETVTGSATAVRNGIAIDLNVGDLVFQGDVVQTRSDSTLAIAFSDGSAFTLNENARMALNEFVYDPNSTSNSALINLVQGTVSFVAAQVAKTGNMRVDTPTATLGIRGTFVTVSVSSTDGHTVASLGLETNLTTGEQFAGAFTLTNRITGNQVLVSQVASMFSVSPAGTIAESAKPPGIQAIEQAAFQALVPVMQAAANFGGTTGPGQSPNQTPNQTPNQNPQDNPSGPKDQGPTNSPSPSPTGSPSANPAPDNKPPADNHVTGPLTTTTPVDTPLASNTTGNAPPVTTAAKDTPIPSPPPAPPSDTTKTTQLPLPNPPPPAPAVSLAQDTGSSGNDLITNNGSLSLSGVAAGASVSYSTDGGTTWSSSFTAVEGPNTVQVRQTDVAGNVSSVTTFSFTLDTTAPAVPGVSLTNDSGSSATDKITNKGALTLSGIENGATVAYSTDGGTTWTNSFTAVEGPNTVQVRQTDVAGNVSGAITFSFTLDTTASTAALAITAIDQDTGSSSSDFITSDTTLTVSGTVGTLGAGEKVQVSSDNGLTWHDATLGTGAAAGTWSYVDPTTHSTSFTYQARVVDTAGNVDTNTASQNVTIDTTASTAALAITAIDQDTGSSSSDFITSDTTLTVSGTVGTLGAGEKVQVSSDNGLTWHNATLGIGADAGTWSYVKLTTHITSFTYQARVVDTAGNVDTNTASQNITIDTTAPTLTAPGPISGTKIEGTGHEWEISWGASTGGSGTITYTYRVTDTTTGTDVTSGTTENTFITTDKLIPNNDSYLITVYASDSLGDVSGTTSKTIVQLTGSSFPAGIASEPINLGLTSPADEGALITATVKDLPSGWTLDGATQNEDGSWTVQTRDVGSLTITTSAEFVGALLLTVTLSWTKADGTTATKVVIDNVEAYAPGSPIFAWSGDDNLTGSSGKDLFVFAQPIGNDHIHSFDVGQDQIDLISYAGFKSFADVLSHLSEDSAGNAVITLGAGQSITLQGVHAAALTAGNFVFDQTPALDNAGTMTIGDGAMLPLSGAIHNSGTITLGSAGNEALLQLLQDGVTLTGGGAVVLSDSDGNVISGTDPSVTLTNVDNTISGAGQIGHGRMTLINAGTIIAVGTSSLIIDTGSNAVINSGTLEATGSGGLIVNSDIANSGLIWAHGGNITTNGAVTGTGSALISGTATLEFSAASSADVTFAADASGTLILKDAAHFTGTISGLSSDDKIDLTNISYATASVYDITYSSNTNITTLLVTDGTNTDAIHLVGNYTINTTWHFSADGQGGTTAVDAPATSDFTFEPSAAALASASHLDANTVIGQVTGLCDSDDSFAFSLASGSSSGFSLSNSGTLSVANGSVGSGTYTLDVIAQDQDHGSSSVIPATLWIGGKDAGNTPASLASDTTKVIALALDGDHVIAGGSGNDLLVAGSGTDTFVFKANFGHDTVANFHPDTDVIAIDHAVFADFQALLTAAHDDGHGSAVITADPHDSITIKNVTVAQLIQHQGDFHFT
jgi:hypothetical protein